MMDKKSLYLGSIIGKYSIVLHCIVLYCINIDQESILLFLHSIAMQ